MPLLVLRVVVVVVVVAIVVFVVVVAVVVVVVLVFPKNRQTLAILWDRKPGERMVICMSTTAG